MKWIFGLIASFLALLWIMGAASSPDEAEQAAKRCQSPDAAYTMAKRFVEKRLRSPSTAEFPSLLSDDVQVGYEGDCTHAVRAYVDAQNGFGAQVRQRFYARVQNERGTSEWVLLKVQIQ